MSYSTIWLWCEGPWLDDGCRRGGALDAHAQAFRMINTTQEREVCTCGWHGSLSLCAPATGRWLLWFLQGLLTSMCHLPAMAVAIKMPEDHLLLAQWSQEEREGGTTTYRLPTNRSRLLCNPLTLHVLHPTTARETLS